jgi:hypothetical protein
MPGPTYSNAPVFWPGSGSVPPITSLGLFDDDDVFQEAAPKIAKWVCSRLGYPVMNIEMQDTQIYDCIEEAITEYSAQVNEFNMRDNMLGMLGQTTASSFTQRVVYANPLPFIIELSAAYGTEVLAGGNVDLKSGSITTINGVQDYDLQALWGAASESGNRIEIRRVFHERFPAISRGGFGFGDVGGMSPTDGNVNLLSEFGWAGMDGGDGGAFGGAGTGGTFLIMPVFETLLRTQAVEFNDQIRRSQYSFELVNNKIKFFPVPGGERIFFQYMVTKDKFAGSGVQTSSGSVVSDYSNAPYDNMWYGNINDVGRRWILKYTLALAKETLGRILSKYENIPAPNLNDTMRMDGPILRQEAEKEKQILWDQLRETLGETQKNSQLTKAAENEQSSQDILSKVPTYIFIG